MVKVPPRWGHSSLPWPPGADSSGSASAAQTPVAAHGASIRQPVPTPADVTAFDHPGVLLPPFPEAASPANQCPLGAAWSEGDACVRHRARTPG